MFQVQVFPSQTLSSAASAPPPEVIDAGRVKTGGACRLAALRVSVQCADAGRVKIGGGCRLPNR